MTVLLLLLLFLLAFANGANDNSKGVATLVGFGTATPKQALLWATLTTALGATFSFWFAGGMIKSFSTGLFVKGTHLGEPFFVAVLVGACAWVLIANFTGLPVSTTHAIFGALLGAGMVAFGSGSVLWDFLMQKFARPLAVSPVLSLIAVYLLALPVVWVVGKVAGRCACVVEEPGSAVPTAQGAAALTASAVSVRVDDEAACEEAQPVAAVSGSSASTYFHWLTSGMIGFARGWNDAPKIAALGMISLTGAHGMAASFAIVTIAMVIGGLVAGGKVLETLARKLTPLPLPEALTASATTAVLVGMASWYQLPVSTTHVSTGAIIGAGLRNDPKGVKWGKVGEIALSWVITLPVAALVAALVEWLLRALGA